MFRNEKQKTDLKTKELLLKTAEELFARNGFKETKISSISESVGISDATVYEHFENKEGLLFDIPRTKTQGLIEINERHLRGLKGAETKLRKLIWNYMEMLDDDPAYASLLVFELRSNRRFYDTESFELMRKVAKPYREAIVEGQKSGDFLTDLSPSVVVNLIFGTIDILMITWLIKKEPKSLLDYFEDIIDLVFHAITVKKSEPPSLDKKAMILDAATVVFAQFGFDKARIQDIARLAGVGEGTIYEHFKNKNEILFTLPLQKTNDLIVSSREHLEGIKDPQHRLIVLIKEYLEFLSTNRGYSKVMIFDLRYNRDFYETRSYDLFREYGLIFYRVIKDGIQNKRFRKEANPFIATKMIFGVIDHCMLSWINFGRPENLLSLSDSICRPIIASLEM